MATQFAIDSAAIDRMKLDVLMSKDGKWVRLVD